MTTERFSNQASTTLASLVGLGDLTLTVQGTAHFPTQPEFRIRIGQELMLVTGVSGVTWTVTRGIEGTLASAHAAGTAVVAVLTAGALDELRAEIEAEDRTASGIRTASTVVVTSSATAPFAGQVLAATNGTAAQWGNPDSQSYASAGSDTDMFVYIDGINGDDNNPGTQANPFKSYTGYMRRHPLLGGRTFGAPAIVATNELSIPVCLQSASETLRLISSGFSVNGGNYASVVLRGTSITTPHGQASWLNGPAANSWILSNGPEVWSHIDDPESFLIWQYRDFVANASLSDTGTTGSQPDHKLTLSVIGIDRKFAPYVTGKLELGAREPIGIVYVHPYFWVICHRDSTLIAINPVTMQIEKTVIIDALPTRLRLGDDGLLYIIASDNPAAEASNVVDVVNPATSAIVNRFIGYRAIDVFVHSGYMYLSTDVNNNLVKFNSTTGALVATIDVGEGGGHFAYAPGGPLYFSTHTGWETQSSVRVYDLATDTVTHVIPNVGLTTYDIAIWNTTLLTGNYGDAGGKDVTFIDLTTNTIKKAIAIGIGANYFGITPNNLAFASCADSSEVVVIDCVEERAVARFAVGTYMIGGITYGGGYVLAVADGNYPPPAGAYAGGRVTAIKVAAREDVTITWSDPTYWGAVDAAPTTSNGVKALPNSILGDLPSDIVFNSTAQHLVVAYPQREGLVVLSQPVTRTAVDVTNANGVIESYEVCDTGVVTASFGIQHVFTYIKDYSDLQGLLVDIDPTAVSRLTISSTDVNVAGRVQGIIARPGTLYGAVAYDYGPIFKTVGPGGLPYFECGLGAHPFNAMNLGSVWTGNPIAALTAGWAVFVGQMNTDPPTAGNGALMKIGGAQGNCSFVPISTEYGGPGIYDGFGNTAFRNTGYLTSGSSAQPFEYQVMSKTNSWQSRYNGNVTHAVFTPNVVDFASTPPTILGDNANTSAFFCGKFSRFALFDHYPNADELRAISILNKHKYGISLVL
jgi:hypothetical protein